MNISNIFRSGKEGECPPPLVYLSVQHPVTRCWAIFEENDATAFFYITEQELPEPVSHCFVHNRAKLEGESPKVWELGCSHPVPEKYATESAFRDNLTEDQIRIEWSVTGDSVVAIIDNIPTALLILGELHGYSRGIRCPGLYGNPWSDEIYSKRFGATAQTRVANGWH